MVGSGMPETYELEILLHYLLSASSKYKRPITVPEELGTLLDSIESALDELDENYVDAPPLQTKVPPALFRYWDTIATAREMYRKSIETTFTGTTLDLAADMVVSVLKRWINEIELGKSRAMSFATHGHGDDGKSGITPTYFSYNITKWRLTGKVNSQGHKLVTAKEMEVHRFPLFLEGPVRQMKTVDEGEARKMYERVRYSGLRDEGLGMYTISASLKGQSYDMGR
jgi:hypothetical protein